MCVSEGAPLTSERMGTWERDREPIDRDADDDQTRRAAQRASSAAASGRCHAIRYHPATPTRGCVRARWQRTRRREASAVVPAPEVKILAQIIQLPIITAQAASLLISWRPANLHVAKVPRPSHQRSPSSTRSMSTYRATFFPHRNVSCGSMPSSTTTLAVALSPCIMPPRGAQPSANAGGCRWTMLVLPTRCTSG